MLARLIATTGEALPALELAALPRVGDTLGLPPGDAWRVMRLHWPISPNASPATCEAVEIHVTPARGV